MRPSNRSERALCVGIVSPLIANPSSLPPAVAVFLSSAVAPAVAGYVAALSAADAAAVRAGHASDANDAAGEAFDGALRLWVRTVTDASGKSLVQQLTPLLGAPPNELLRLQSVEKAERMVRFVPRVSGTALGGDPARLAALATAAAALTDAAVELRSAEGARINATATLREAERTFDKAWVALDRVATAVDPAGNLELRFVRAAKSDRVAAEPAALTGPTNVLPWPSPALAAPVAPVGEDERPGAEIPAAEDPAAEAPGVEAGADADTAAA